MGGKFEHSTAQASLCLGSVSQGQNQSIHRAKLLFEGSEKNSLPNSFKLSEFISLWLEGRGPCFVAGCGSHLCTWSLRQDSSIRSSPHIAHLSAGLSDHNQRKFFAFKGAGDWFEPSGQSRKISLTLYGLS